MQVALRFGDSSVPTAAERNAVGGPDNGPLEMREEKHPLRAR
jgi:hypothetical protein